MPTTVVSKIGATNTPTTMDFSTLQSWEDACPADLVADDKIWKGECYDQGKFTAGLSVSGQTVDATRYVWLTCASGASFSTKAGVRSTALLYNDAGGVAVEMSAAANFTISSQHTRIEGLQLKQTGYTLCINAAAANVTVKDCILTRSGGAGNLGQDGATTDRWLNCLFQYMFSSGNALNGLGKAYNCTFANAGGTAGTSSAIESQYNAYQANNCAFFGFSGDNIASTGTLNSSSDYNASDLASIAVASGGGTHDVLNLTFANQFESTTTDFRAKSGNGLQHGTPDATNAPLDISQFDRDDTTPTIGAWEFSAPSGSISASPSAVPEEHVGNITLTLTGTSTTWAGGGSEFSVSGVAGTSKISENVTSATAATLVIETTSSATGTLTITDADAFTGTVSVATPTLTVTPTSVTVNDTPTITLTGTNTVWLQETEATLFSEAGVAGVSIGTIDVTTNTAATAVLTTGATTGTDTITDESTGATDTVDVAAVSGTLTITTPTNFHGYRMDGSNQADIPIVGTYTGGPSSKAIEADFDGGGYATIATGTGGNFSGTLSNQAAGQGTLTVRFVDATSISDTVAYVSIGVVIAIAGQSNAAGILDNFQDYAHATLKAVCYKAGNSSYSAPGFWDDATEPLIAAFTTGSPWPLLATHLMESLGVPVIFIETAIGGRTLVYNNWYWTKYRPDTGGPGGGSSSPLIGFGEIAYSIATAATGGVDAVIWYQGESDVDGGTIERHVYAQAVGTFADQIGADVSNSPPLAVVQFGHDGTETPVDPEWADAVKLALSDFARSGGNVIDGVVTVSDFSDSLHILTDAEGQKVADRMYALLKSELFGGTAGAGRGPRVTACQYNASRTAVTVCFDKVLKTGLTFNTTLWAVTGNGTPATVSAVAYHASDTRAVVLTLSGAATLPILVSFALGGGTAGKVWPLGPDFTLPGGAGTINLPAEMFSNQPAAAAEVSVGGGGGASVCSSF